MKRAKRCLAVIVILSVLLSISSQAAGISLEDRLEALANAYITVQCTESDDVLNVTYANLQGFYAAVYEQIPDVSDEELAAFVMQYTQQGDLEDFPEGMVSEILGSYSVSGAIQTLTNSIFEDSEVEWKSEDGYMQIKIYALNKGINSEGYRFYYIWAMADWIKEPFWRFTDTLALVYGGVCNGNDGVTAYFQQEAVCSACGKRFTTSSEDKFENGSFTQNQSGIELDFSQGGAVGAKFQLDHVSRNCGDPDDLIYTKMRAFVSCFTWVDSVCEIKGAYAHKKIGIPGDVTIGVSVDDKGNVTPQFSALFGVNYTAYTTPSIVLTP